MQEGWPVSASKRRRHPACEVLRQSEHRPIDHFHHLQTSLRMPPIPTHPTGRRIANARHRLERSLAAVALARPTAARWRSPVPCPKTLSARNSRRLSNSVFALPGWRRYPPLHAAVVWREPGQR